VGVLSCMDLVGVASGVFLVFMALIVGGVMPIVVEVGRGGGELARASDYIVASAGRSTVVLMGVGALVLISKRTDNETVVIAGLAMVLGLEIVMPVI